MEIAFLPADLHRWDAARGDMLVVGAFSDVRPLRGATGLLDWRLCGRLSSWIAAGRFSGATGEQTLSPSGGRVPWPSVLVLGLGPFADFGESGLREVLRRTATTANGLGFSRLAVALPGRDGDRISARRAVEIVMDEWGKSRLGDVTLIDTPAAHKEMADVLRQRRQPAATPAPAPLPAPAIKLPRAAR